MPPKFRALSFRRIVSDRWRAPPLAHFLSYRSSIIHHDGGDRLGVQLTITPSSMLPFASSFLFFCDTFLLVSSSARPTLSGV